MSIIAYEDILVIIFFILPGYIVLYTTSIFTDYLYEKETLDRIIHYLFFSFICYSISTMILAFAFIKSGQMTLFDTIRSLFNLSIFKKYNLHLSIISLILAPQIGFLLGNYYFNKGYPFKHFRKHTTRKYVPSIYAELIREFSKGAWITLYLNDRTIIQGKIFDFDRDEDKRDYVVSITEAERCFPDIGSTIKLKGEKIVINLKNTNMVELNK